MLNTIHKIITVTAGCIIAHIIPIYDPIYRTNKSRIMREQKGEKRMDKMYEYIKRRGGRITDRELALELGLSKSAVQRRRVKLAGMGLISYKVSSRRGGTEYEVGQSGAKSGAKSGILYISKYNNQERERRVRAREGVGEDAVLAAWKRTAPEILCGGAAVVLLPRKKNDRI